MLWISVDKSLWTGAAACPGPAGRDPPPWAAEAGAAAAVLDIYPPYPAKKKNF